jgi:hypothetical protein
MAWLDRLLGRHTTSPSRLRADDLCGDPAAHEWAARLGRGDWRGAGRFPSCSGEPGDTGQRVCQDGETGELDAAEADLEVAAAFDPTTPGRGC